MYVGTMYNYVLIYFSSKGQNKMENLETSFSVLAKKAFANYLNYELPELDSSWDAEELKRRIDNAWSQKPETKQYEEGDAFDIVVDRDSNGSISISIEYAI